ncbi:MAG: flagellar hook-associated protein FlgK [Ignavibacteria bacterium]|jgi:flagellar hook-associated protein 1 FlgK|nr:flagellar hook-associated protein FlgK [Ignavibacteria bacterium]
MSTFSTLEIGKRALQASNFALDVTSNNVANATTEGYSRRVAQQSQSNPFNKYGYQLGTGVDIDSMRSFRQEYLDREVRKANANLASYEADVNFYSNVETILQEPTDNNLGQLFNDLLTAFDDLALQPESIGLRENLITNTQTFVERLNNASSDLQAMRAQANTDLTNEIHEANEYISQIVNYNKAISISKDKSHNDSLTFMDKREVAIEALSKLGNITVTYEDTGLANVFMNGINVVTGATGQTLKVVESNNQETGESNLSVVVYNEKKDYTVPVNPTSGKIAASQKQYNILLDPVDTSGAFSIMKTLDTYANTIADKINSIFATGYGINDTAGDPPGRVMFVSNTGEPITAGNIRVSDDMKNAADMPLSGTANTPGNSDVARAISRIMQDGFFLNGQTPSEFYSNFIGHISNDAQAAVAAKKSSQLVVESLNSTRDSVMGVNMDEEAINLIKYQKNLEAAAKIIAINSQVLSTIVNLGK